MALISVGLALAARMLLTPVIGPGREPFLTLFGAIMLSAWYGGFGPALAAVVVGALSAEWILRRPANVLLPATLEGWIDLAMVLAIGVTIAALGGAMRSARLRAEASAKRAHRVEEELEDVELRARAVLDMVLSGIVSIDAQGRVQTFNPAAERMFGYAAAEVIGQNVSLLMPAPQSEQHDRYLAEYLRTGVPKVLGIGREVTGRRKDGTTFPLELALSDSVLHGQHIFTAILRDLTERKRAEERERQLERRAQQRERLADIGAMTARIAHDIGNPLAGLSMTVQRILRRMARTPNAPLESLRDVFSSIVTTVGQLDSLVAAFKDFAREQHLEVKDIPLPAFLEEIATAWEAEAASREITFEIDATNSAPTIRGDAEKLRRVFDNLVRNAFEAMDRGPGSVRIVTTIPEPEKVRIAIEDTGPGIPEHIDVFGLFETTKTAGTGLGLPICRQIVVAHGGGIEFAARSPRGAVFYVDLPLQGPLVRRAARSAG